MGQQKGEAVGSNMHEVEGGKSEDSKRRYQEQAAGEEGSNGSMKEIVVGIYSNLKRQLEKSAEEEVSRRRQKENAVSEGSTRRKVQ